MRSVEERGAQNPLFARFAGVVGELLRMRFVSELPFLCRSEIGTVSVPGIACDSQSRWRGMLRLIGCDVFLVLQRQPNIIEPV